MELAPRHKFLRAVASSDILKFRVSEMAFSGVFKRYVLSSTADAMLFRQNTRKTGNNTVDVPIALFERFTDLNQFKHAFNVNQNWETDERGFAWSRHRILRNSQCQE